MSVRSRDRAARTAARSSRHAAGAASTEAGHRSRAPSEEPRRTLVAESGRTPAADIGRTPASGTLGASRAPVPGAARILVSDRGSATVWTVGVIAFLCVVFGAVLAMGQAVVVRHRAAGAADLAALAAADHWMDGGAVACAQADRVARAQHARLVRCAVEGEISDVTAASGPGPFGVEVRSRAGPAGPATPVPSPPAPPATAP